MKVYLGDAVYADRNEFDELILTTEDGIEVTNSIVLNEVVIKQLLRFIKENLPED